ncbi:MAG: alpha/beta fold hydrolase [Candidatus Aenigmarchaeota archaeon]|nr:alpha/beta fold hydrolase [Candidatus Aenigmarchaeota archaeon]
MSEQVSFKAEDGFEVVGSFYKSTSDTGVILLHMLNRNRSDWNAFAGQLNKEGYNVLSIDLRGHGQSLKKGGRTVEWQTFSAKDFNDMILDVKAAKEFLEQKGISKISLIGASIGANIALNYATEDIEIKTTVLLSPGLDYRGVKIDDNVRDYGNRPMLIVASEDDEYSATSSKTMSESAAGKKELKIYADAGHGTKMFSNTDLDKVIVNWLEQYGN